MRKTVGLNSWAERDQRRSYVHQQDSERVGALLGLNEGGPEGEKEKLRFRFLVLEPERSRGRKRRGKG